MEAFVSSGRVVDLILVVMALEFAALVTQPGRKSRREAAIDAALGLAPGACLLLALKAALTDSGWPWVAFWIAASFPLHLADLRRRRA